MEDFFDYLNKSVSLNDEAKSFISSVIKIEKFNKGDILIRQGQAQVLNNYFVLSGFLRSYTNDENGKDHTVQFAIKDWWITDNIAFYGEEKAVLNVECLSDSIVVKSDKLSIEKVFDMFPQIETFHRKNLEKTFLRLNKRIVNQLELNARDRYLKFLDDFPAIESIAKNYHIASYLGITQQSLSRIRADILG